MALRCIGRFALATSIPSAVLLAGSVRASPFAMMGHDADTAAVAASNVSFGESVGVLHVNPALLTQVPRSVQASLLVFAPRLRIELQPKPPSTDVPLSIYDSNVGSTAGVQDRALPTSELLRRRSDTRLNGADTYLGIGVAHDFQVAHFRVGMLLELPLASSSAASVATHYDDEREAAFSNRLHFTRFGEWNQILAVAAGAAYEPLHWLSVGVAGEFAASARARIAVYIPDAAVQSYAQSNMETEVSSKLRPIVGVRATPLEWLALGLTWRNQTYFQVEGTSDLTLWNYHEADPNRTIPKRTSQVFPVVFGWQPMEVSLGVGARGAGVTGQVAATWQRWSRYLDNHGFLPENGAVLPPGASRKAAVDPSELRFRDVVALQGGAQWRYTSWGAASAGAAWYPTPVPPQTGRTSFVDTDLVGVTAGNRFDFEIAGRPLAVTLVMQLWRLAPRTTHKDPARVLDEFPDDARTLRGGQPMPEASGLQTNSPGFPGYSTRGFLMTWGASISHKF